MLVLCVCVLYVDGWVYVRNKVRYWPMDDDGCGGEGVFMGVSVYAGVSIVLHVCACTYR